MLLLPRVSFRCRHFRCSHETAIELKVFLANEKLTFHSYLLEGMERIAHCAQEEERSSSYCLPERSRKDDDKLEHAATNVAKRLVGRKAVIKTGTSRKP